MALEQVGAKAPKVGKEWAGSMEIPDTAQGMIETFGDAAVRSSAWADYKIRAQSNIRSWLAAGKSDSEIQDLVNGMKMGVSIPRTGGGISAATAKTKILSDWSKMSDGERKNFMAALKEAQKAAQG